MKAKVVNILVAVAAERKLVPTIFVVSAVIRYLHSLRNKCSIPFSLLTVNLDRSFDGAA
jgi:hypothetical protein